MYIPVFRMFSSTVLKFSSTYFHFLLSFLNTSLLDHTLSLMVVVYHVILHCTKKSKRYAGDFRRSLPIFVCYLIDLEIWKKRLKT